MTRMLPKSKVDLANIRYLNIKQPPFTTEKYKNDLKELGLDRKAIPVEEYVDCHTPINHLFFKCGHIYPISPSNLKKGRGCGRCRGNGRNTEVYKQDLLDRGIVDLVPIEEYVNTQTAILHKCSNGHIRKMYPGNVLRGYKCKICSQTKTHEQYVKELQMKMPTIKILDKYSGSKESDVNIFECKICGNQWVTHAYYVLAGKGCPECNNMSSGERIIKYVLDEYGIKYIYEMKFDGLYGINGGLLSYDFYLPEYNLLIEFQGLQHKKSIDFFGGEKTLEKQFEHDFRKRKYAIDNGYELLEIDDSDKTNIKSILIKKLNLESVETA